MNRIAILRLSLALPLLLAAFLLSCDKEVEGPDDGVGIRIENLSTYTFDEVLLEAGGGGENRYTNIPPGSTTEYKSFEYTYRYAFFQTVIGQDTLTLQPIDYFGEQQFTSGNYTFQIDIIGEATPAYMVFEFRQD